MQDDCKLAMAGTISEDFGTSLRPSVSDGVLSEQRCPSGDSVTEWRSSEQVENATTSTSPPYWDIDEDDDCGPKPSELYGRFTWKIESFSTMNKRELRSNAFEVGGYRWYILIYPQGCDVCNHLSLFLCVANHDKLLPGWSHFAQFTIAVVNEDPKKSKYSDTLHKFWKKEHDWGWKKFMELSKVYDGFINDDTLIIKAQVQVIREKADRPFRCLDTQYRRELVRVYLSNVEQICLRFLEERIGKLSKFMEDKLRWSSFRIFWLGIDPSSRLHMSRDKTDAILKVVVKHFFIEKEVTSTLIMDSLYNGLKALEFQCENLKCRDKSVDLEELPAPVIHIDEDLFVLADDILLLMKRVVSNFLPHQSLPLKDDKCLLNRKKEGNSGDEATRDSIECDERRLMELGRRTIETFVLVHIFGRVEVSFKEAISLKRQEELIREEEAAFLAENDLKSKLGAAEKEKRAKKKQAKQKRNNRKGKEKGKNGTRYLVQEALEQTLEERTSNSSSKPVELAIESIGALADVSDTVDDVAYMVQPFDDRDASPTWDIYTSEPCPAIEASVRDVQIEHIEKRSQCVTDDSSSTCSTDSIPALFTNGAYKGAHLPNNITKSSPDRQNNLQNSETHDGRSSILSTETILVDGCSNYASGIKADQSESAGTLSSFKNELQHQKIQGEKEEVLSLQNNQTADDQFDAQRQSSSLNRGVKENIITQLPKHTLPLIVANTVLITSTSKVEPRCRKESHSSCAVQGDMGLAHPSRSQPTSLSETQKHSSSEQANAMSRPSSAPLTPALRLTAAISPIVQAVPLLSCSVSAAGRLGTDPSPSAASFLPQSYRNVIIGKTTSARMAGFIYDTASSVQSVRHFQAPSVHPSASSKLPPQTPLRNDQTSIQSGLTFGCLNPEALHHETCSNNQSSTQRFGSVLVDNMEKLSICGKSKKEQAGIASATTPSQLQATIAEEFPHLDIINDLLEDEHDVGWTSRGPHLTFNRQYSLPGNLTASCQFDHFEQYYEEGFLRSYGAFGNPLQTLSDEPLQQLEFSSYPNRYTQFDGLTRNHGPYGSNNLSVHRLGDGDANGYHYQIDDYLLREQNGYYYRPANDL